MQKISIKDKDDKLSKKAKAILIAIILVLAAVGLFAFCFLKYYHVYETKVVKPTCTEKGYTQSTCIFCNKIIRKHYTKALGHDYGEKKLKSDATETDFGERIKTCKRCKHEVSYPIYPKSTMKKFYFSGAPFEVNSDMITQGILTYDYNGEHIEKYVEMQYADRNTSRYIKHNYNITFFKNDKFEEKDTLNLMENEGERSTWALYGNYYDFYNLRSSVANDIFKQVRSSYTAPNKEASGNFGTVESEPVLMYINNTFTGIYRLFAPINSETETNLKAVVNSDYSSSDTKFKLETSKNGAWRVKYNYKLPKDTSELKDKEIIEKNEWIYDSLNELINFVYEKEGDEFKKGISSYLDVDATIDYMITVYNLCAADNVSHNMMLQTTDGKVWTPILFSANASFGLNLNGEIDDYETVLAPDKKNANKGDYVSDTSSMLFEKMINSFYPEIKDRYEKTKDTVFSPKNVISLFDKYKSQVGDSVYEREKTAYKVVNSDIDLEKNITSFSKSRKKVLGKFFK